MFQKLTHLRSLADSAHAELMQVAEQLRDCRDQFHRLDRHKIDLENKRFKLAAPDAAKHAELEQRIAFLESKHAKVRADHKAKRQLSDRCNREAQNA